MSFIAGCIQSKSLPHDFLGNQKWRINNRDLRGPVSIMHPNLLHIRLWVLPIGWKESHGLKNSLNGCFRRLSSFFLDRSPSYFWSVIRKLWEMVDSLIYFPSLLSLTTRLDCWTISEPDLDLIIPTFLKSRHSVVFIILERQRAKHTTEELSTIGYQSAFCSLYQQLILPRNFLAINRSHISKHFDLVDSSSNQFIHVHYSTTGSIRGTMDGSQMNRYKTWSSVHMQDESNTMPNRLLGLVLTAIFTYLFIRTTLALFEYLGVYKFKPYRSDEEDEVDDFTV